jgi:ATP-binding cassette subfamily C exporter for protease/lipase
VAENIARFGEVDLKRVQEAAQRVGLVELIESLPQGFDTQVGRDGAVLSGGQRQRVALARALYGNPALVVLDEPNSSLDEAGDAALNRAIQEVKSQGAAVVVITHRSSVLPVTEKILMLRDGAQQAFGPRDEVLAAMQRAQQQAQAAAQQAASPQNQAAATSPALANPAAGGAAA